MWLLWELMAGCFKNHFLYVSLLGNNTLRSAFSSPEFSGSPIAVPGVESLRPFLEVRDPERQEGRGTDSRSHCGAVTGGPVPQRHSFLDQVRRQCGRLTSEKDSAGSFQTQSLYCHPFVGSASCREASWPSPSHYNYLPALLLG